MMRCTLLICGGAIAASLFVPAAVEAGDWTRFRGPNGSGISEETAPTEWGPEKNIKWAIDLPGRGVSSPIVVGDRVFVTCYSGYGMSRDDVGEIAELKRHLVCVDRNSGEVRWTQTVGAALPEDPYSGAGVPAHGYASHTPVSDGERVYVFFGKSGVFAFDLEGNRLWQASVGTESGAMRWGSAASPIVYGDTVIVNASDESEAMVALDKQTGEEKWRKEAAGLGGTWGTPILMESDSGKEIVLAVPNEVWSFDAETGKFKWYAKGPEDQTVSHSVIGEGGIVYSIGGRGGNFVAVRTGGSGEIPEEELVWESRASGRFASPVLYHGLLFNVSGGVLTCYNAESGERIHQTRLAQGDAAGDDASRERGPRGPEAERRGGPPAGQPGREGRGGRGGRGGGFGSSDYASPVVAGGNLIITMNDGTVYVVKATDSYELVSVNRLPDDDSGFAGTPAVSDGDLFFRSHEKLYCVSDE
jgi:outer membrane protein assembly factor BamB